jgi:hypothetical protein
MQRACHRFERRSSVGAGHVLGVAAYGRRLPDDRQADPDHDHEAEQEQGDDQDQGTAATGWRLGRRLLGHGSAGTRDGSGWITAHAEALAT